jgi:hypothetical protein
MIAIANATNVLKFEDEKQIILFLFLGLTALKKKSNSSFIEKKQISAK